MSKVARILGFFSLGVGISLIVGYWLKQEEMLNRQRLQPQPYNPPPPPPEIVLSKKTLDAAETADDLTSIKGIGAKTAEALKAVGISTFAALAVASPADLIERLDGLRGVNLEKMEQWIKDAKEHKS